MRIPHSRLFLFCQSTRLCFKITSIACLIALLCGTVFSPQIAEAAPTTKERAKTSFTRGKVAFDEGRFPEALTAFEEAYQLFPLPLMLYNIANVYERLELLPQALEAYRTFIKTGKDTSGEAERRAKAIQSEMSAWPEVTITSIPSGSKVRLFSKTHPVLGETPLTLKLKPREDLTLWITPTEGEAIKHQIKVSSSPQRQTVSLDLPKQDAYVRVMGSPTELQAKSGDQKTSGIPSLMKLSVGDHEIELYAPGYLPVKRSVSLRSVHTKEAPLTLEVSLKTSEGVALIALNVSVPGALLFVDGLPKGQSPFDEPLELSEGEHLIELKGPNGESFREALNLKAGEMAQLNVDFSNEQTFLSRDRLTLGLMSIGGASVLTGFVLGGFALSASGDLDDCRAHELCRRRQGELDRAQALRAFSLSADLFSVIGLLVGGAGGVMYWLDRHEIETALPVKPSVQMSTHSNGGQLSASFTF